MYSVSNYVGKGNISEEIVEVSLVFIQVLFQRKKVVLLLYISLFTVLLGYMRK